MQFLNGLYFSGMDTYYFWRIFHETFTGHNVHDDICNMDGWGWDFWEFSRNFKLSWTKYIKHFFHRQVILSTFYTKICFGGERWQPQSFQLSTQHVTILSQETSRIEYFKHTNFRRQKLLWMKPSPVLL